MQPKSKSEIINILELVSNDIGDLKMVAGILTQYDLHWRHEKYMIRCARYHIEGLERNFKTAWSVCLERFTDEHGK